MSTVKIDKTCTGWRHTDEMVSLIVHLVLGVVAIAWLIRSNPQIFSRVAGGPTLSGLEMLYYVIGIASIALFGNTQQPVDVMVKTSHLFAPLPEVIREDMAFLDRLQALLDGTPLPGWLERYAEIAGHSPLDAPPVNPTP